MPIPKCLNLKSFKIVLFRLISSLIYIVFLHPPFENATLNFWRRSPRWEDKQVIKDYVYNLAKQISTYKPSPPPIVKKVISTKNETLTLY